MQAYNLLRGLLAIWILLGHCSGSITVHTTVFSALQKFNLGCVGIFFFLSGYGLENSLKRKKDYLHHFLLRKCGSLFIMAAVQFFVSMAFEFILRYHVPIGTPGEFFHRLFRDINWFVWELMLLYFLFYLMARLIRKEGLRLILLFILSIAFLVLFWALKMGGSWYYSTLAFPAGCALCMYREQGEKEVERHYVPILLMTSVFAALSAVAAFFTDKAGLLSVCGKNLFCVALALLGVLILLKLRPEGKILRYLARISPEIFLYQFTASAILYAYAIRHKWEERGLLYALCNLLLTLLFAAVFSEIRIRLQKKKA